MANSSDSNRYGEALMVSDKASTSFLYWNLDSTCLHHICCREELFDTLESKESFVHLPNGSSLHQGYWDNQLEDT